jgi:hypothetical protein
MLRIALRVSPVEGGRRKHTPVRSSLSQILSGLVIGVDIDGVVSHLVDCLLSCR